MNIIEYPVEIRLELIAKEIENDIESDTQHTELLQCALEVHDMRFALAEMTRKREQAVRSGNHWYRLWILTALFALISPFIIHIR